MSAGTILRVPPDIAASAARIVEAHDAWDRLTSKHEVWQHYCGVAIAEAPVVARALLEPEAAFDPMADAQANYAMACKAMRLRAVLTAERWATEHDEFDLVLAAAMMRGRR